MRLWLQPYEQHTTLASRLIQNLQSKDSDHGPALNKVVIGSWIYFRSSAESYRDSGQNLVKDSYSLCDPLTSHLTTHRTAKKGV